MKISQLSYSVNSIFRLFALVLTVMIFASNFSISGIDNPVLIIEHQDNGDTEEESEINILEEDLFLVSSNHSNIHYSNGILVSPMLELEKLEHFRRIPSPPPEVF